MTKALRFTIAFLGLYAGLIAIQHGIFESLQGSRSPGGLLFNAIGPPCQSDAVWHACFPAVTLMPNLFVSGIAAILVGLGMAVWAAFYVERKRGGLVLGALSILALLVGGGFVPVFIGLAAAAASILGRTPARPTRLPFLAVLWPWPLVVMTLWLPGSWLLGHFFSAAMLAASGLLFLVFDIGLPVLAVVSSATLFEQSKKQDD